jgi:hypothetical protein
MIFVKLTAVRSGRVDVGDSGGFLNKIPPTCGSNFVDRGVANCILSEAVPL